MKIGKFLLGGTLIAAGTYVYKWISRHEGNIVLYFPGKSFFVFSKYPFSEDIDEHIDNLHATLASIYDEYLDSLEIDDLNSRFYKE